MKLQPTRSFTQAAGIILCCISLLVGCGRRPNQVNIQLRKEIQSLQDEIAQLSRQRDGDLATIRALQQQGGWVPTLPPERLERLFTAHGVQIGRLSGGVDDDRSRPGDEALRVYAAPVDQAGDPIKAAGSFLVEAFDLSLGEQNLVGRWEYSRDEAARNWYSGLMNYTYAFTEPWQRDPRGEHITVRVTFEDELTGRVFTAQRAVRVVPPESAGPVTQPAPARANK